MSQAVDNTADPTDTEYYAYVYGFGDGMEIVIYGNNTRDIAGRKEFTDAKEFVDEVPAIFSNTELKAILLYLDRVPTGEYKNEYELTKATKAQLDTIQHDVKYYFMGYSVWITTQFLIAANISAEPGDIILAVDINDPPGTCGVFEIRRTEDGFRRSAFRMIDPKSNSLSKNANRKYILGPNVPSKIILQVDKPNNQLMKIVRDKLLTEDCEKHVVIEEPLVNFADEFVLNTCKWIMDRTYTKFHVIPRTTKRYFLGYSFAGDSVHILDTEDTQYLPYSKSKIIPKSHFQCFVGYMPHFSVKADILETFDLPEQAHQHKITFDIDIDNILSFGATAVINDKIAALPETLSKMSTSKAPVIGLFEDISVICLPKDDGGYEFMEKWNGIYGKDLYISFDKEEPQFFEDAVKTYKAKQSHVVHNLLKIISMTYDDADEKMFPDIEPFIPAMPVCNCFFDARMPFKIQPDDQGETLIEYKSYDGKSKTATPTSLMSLLFEEHLKVIEAETGEKPKEIGFCVFGDFDEEAKKRIEKCLENFCKLRAINCFVVHENV